MVDIRKLYNNLLGHSCTGNRDGKMERNPLPLLNSTVPGLILGPDEALCASIEWLIESLRLAPSRKRKYAPKLKIHTNTRIRRQLIQLYLLFGRIDVQSGRHLLDTYLRAKDGYPSARELFQDFTDSLGWRSSPFSHSLETGAMGLRSSERLQLDSFTPIVNAIGGALRRVGFREVKVRDPEDIRLQRRKDFTLREIEDVIVGDQNMRDGVLAEIVTSYVGRCVFSTTSALERSIDHGVPYWSSDAIGPYWIPNELVSDRLKILKVIFEDVEWFPNPQTFSEAMEIADDPRMVDLRNNLDLWLHKLGTGEYHDISDIRKHIRDITTKFNNKPWATKVGRFVTYIAVPATVLDSLLTGGVIGTTLLVVGAGAQGLGDRIEKSKRKSWVSLGHDAYFTKP